MTELSRAVFAVAPTRRRRYLWCAWWTGEPRAEPFRPPDAWGGGATSEAEARRMAEAAAGRPLDPIASNWAGAWRRVLAGQAPFPSRSARRQAGHAPGNLGVDPYVLLGVGAADPLEQVKAAYRKKALEHHPDRGGSAASFMAIKRAYDVILRRRARR